MVIQGLHIEVAIDIQLSVVGNGITQIRSIIKVCTTYPVIGGRIGSITGNPIEDRQFVKGQLQGGCKRLLVVERRSEMTDTLPYRVFPCLITLRIEVFIDGGIRLFYLCMCGRLETHVQVLRQVPANSELTIPEELLVEGQWQLLSLQVFHVTLL